jgi:tRNA(fMet)-specific endonuclease VapC
VTSGYLLDTNHIELAVNPGSIVRRRVVEMRTRGVKIGTCAAVLCEVEVGIQQIQRPDEYRWNLERLLRQVRVWPITPETARLYGIIYRDLKSRGRALSQVDMMLAALCRQMNLTLATTDRDFAALPDVPVEDWTN